MEKHAHGLLIWILCTVLSIIMFNAPANNTKSILIILCFIFGRLKNSDFNNLYNVQFQHTDCQYTFRLGINCLHTYSK